MLDYTINPEKYDEITVEDAEDHARFVDELNYLIEEGFIALEEDTNGEVRAYPISR